MKNEERNAVKRQQFYSGSMYNEPTSTLCLLLRIRVQDLYNSFDYNALITRIHKISLGGRMKMIQSKENDRFHK